jgi:crotonobetainyl-CoA:carnitine CoA-transferase CaiB-like acyl-CoA transferase
MWWAAATVPISADPQVQHIGMAAPLKTQLFGDTRFVASPLNFQGMPRKLRSETPEPGQHTQEVLTWIGISKDEQAKLKAAGAM